MRRGSTSTVRFRRAIHAAGLGGARLEGRLLITHQPTRQASTPRPQSRTESIPVASPKPVRLSWPAELTRPTEISDRLASSRRFRRRKRNPPDARPPCPPVDRGNPWLPRSVPPGPAWPDVSPSTSVNLPWPTWPQGASAWPPNSCTKPTPQWDPSPGRSDPRTPSPSAWPSSATTESPHRAPCRCSACPRNELLTKVGQGIADAVRAWCRRQETASTTHPAS